MVAAVPILPFEGGAGALCEAVQAELDRFGRADTPDGAAALYAARLLDAGVNSGASAAALLKAMRDAVAAAVKGAPGAMDLVDELRARRANRGA